jgi:c-di-GMP-binding flagellar brake protein YcgR
MMTSTVAHYDWHRAALVMFAGGQPIELTAVDPLTHEPVGPTSRTRILDIHGGRCLVELPSHRDTAASIRHTHHAMMLLVDSGVRLQCVVRIDEVIKHQLNAQTEVWALRMSEPLHVQSAQRRAFFRAMTAHLKLMVNMQPLAETPLHTGIEIPDGPPFRAMMVNVSGGGLGVIAPQRVGTLIQHYGRYRCSVALPTHDEPLAVTVKHVHLHSNDDGTHYMGLAFKLADVAERHRVEDSICRFTTWLQRQQLARQH